MKIELEFKDVRSTYFPRWDRNQEWTAKVAGIEESRGATAYCDSQAKTVYIYEHDYFRLPRDSVRAFLVHEVCHDIATAGHLRPWAHRMMAAIRLARQQGEYEVARQLFWQIKAECGNGALRPFTFRTVVEFVDLIDVNFEESIERTARHFASTPAAVRSKYGAQIADICGKGPVRKSLP